MALKRIVLRDFVIVQALDLDWHAGFTVLTGETGAGKSILIDALQLALGARADADVVREGCTQADICVEFDGCARLRPWLGGPGPARRGRDRAGQLCGQRLARPADLPCTLRPPGSQAAMAGAAGLGLIRPG